MEGLPVILNVEVSSQKVSRPHGKLTEGLLAAQNVARS